MARSLPTVVVNAVYARSTSIPFFVLLEATHSSFATIRIVNNPVAITSNGDTYQPFPFAVILPPDQEDLTPQAEINIYDAEREIIDNLRAVAGNRERIEISLYVIANNDPDTILASVSGLEVTNASYRAGALQITAEIESFLSEGFPVATFNPGNFPGLF